MWTWLSAHQTLMVGIVGFLGVIITLRFNAHQARKQRHSFFYDPALGNLLFEFINFSGEDQEFFFDSVIALGDSVSRLVGGTSSAVTGTLDTLGLVARFTTTTVPEPSTLALLGAGLLGLFMRRKCVA